MFVSMFTLHCASHKLRHHLNIELKIIFWWFPLKNRNCIYSRKLTSDLKSFRRKLKLEFVGFWGIVMLQAMHHLEGNFQAGLYTHAILVSL